MYVLKSYGIDTTKSIRDPIYGFVELPADFVPVVNHMYFQRLRWVSQLPLEQLVYPSAQHSRFEHSLGCMHLAMHAAISLVRNSRDILHEAFGMDAELAGMLAEEQERQFVMAAGLASLLHDVGHAPFSHTLEDACLHVPSPDITYDHEDVTYVLVNRMFEELGMTSHRYGRIALKVLNKSLKDTTSGLDPVEMIVRKLIDGPIDVDKGDYLLRDSYHCGVTYGQYDHTMLWRNIVITGEFMIGVKEKGALEAWRIRMARYTMYKNVYKHHVRDATDALLSEIFSDLFSSLYPERKESLTRVFPFDFSGGNYLNELDFDAIQFWTDNTLLKEMEAVSTQRTKNKIRDFIQRKLFKVGPVIPLFDFPEALSLYQSGDPGEQKRLFGEITRLKKTMFDAHHFEWNFTIYNEPIAPVFEEEVYPETEADAERCQEQIQIVFADGKRSVSIAEYLGFVQKEARILTSTPSIHLFVAETGKVYEKEIEHAVRDCLRNLE